MTQQFMLCRNRAAGFAHWKSVFDAGVIDGEYHFIRNPGTAE